MGKRKTITTTDARGWHYLWRFGDPGELLVDVSESDGGEPFMEWGYAKQGNALGPNVALWREQAELQAVAERKKVT